MQVRLIALALVVLIVPRTVAADDDDEEEDDEDLASVEDEDDEEDEDQPPVTAGGLYTIETYPLAESQRPLSMTKDLVELRLGLGVDATNANAFGSVGGLGEVRYGVEDNIELRGGFWGIKNFSLWQADVAFEGSLIYELVDLRVGVRLARNPDTEIIDPKEGRTLDEGGLVVSLPIGFPFRYSPRPEVTVTALETAIAIDLDSAPDALPSVGIVIQPASVVALIVHASVAIPNFDFRVTPVVPITAAVQLSPTNRLDAGVEFRFGNHNLPAGTDADGDGKADAFYDDRFATFFARYRMAP